MILRRTLFILALLMYILRTNGQTITIGNVNQFDKEGKKNGIWKLYYNQYWHVVQDSSKALFYWYTYYDHGLRIYTEADWGCKTCKFKDSLIDKHEGNLKLLNGKYTWYDKKGNLFSEHYFKNGQPVWWKQYYSSGKLYLFFDYTKKCEDEPHSWWLYIYDKQGNLKETLPTAKGCGGFWSNVK
ncbi:MAG: hypothetical protein JNM96_05595 [Bacteroidia bacterium]|nr:hypothetical protein [Bacteroidia bacterium]